LAIEAFLPKITLSPVGTAGLPFTANAGFSSSFASARSLKKLSLSLPDHPSKINRALTCSSPIEGSIIASVDREFGL